MYLRFLESFHFFTFQRMPSVQRLRLQIPRSSADLKRTWIRLALH
uniref:Uncharacterized protein n=1 Tax=Anguilla anguilla TaxID=7936 RepID=A0A0E9XYX9_ANGAN